MKMQAYQQKTEKFFVIEEKKFVRIDSWVMKLLAKRCFWIDNNMEVILKSTFRIKNDFEEINFAN